MDAERTASELAGPTPTVVGDLMIKIEAPWSQAEVRDRAVGQQVEIGYCFDPRYSGLGYATEAAREAVRYCFEDLGMRREIHAVADSLHRNGKWYDSFGYAILASEWRGL